MPLRKYIVSVGTQRLQQIADKGVCEGPDGHNKEKLFEYVTNIAG